MNAVDVKEDSLAVITGESTEVAVIRQLADELTPVALVVRDLKAEADALVVFDDDGGTEGVAILGKIKTLQNQMEMRRKETSGRLDALAKKINAVFKAPKEQLDGIRHTVEKKVVDYRDQVKRERDAEAKRVKDLIDAENARIAAEKEAALKKYADERRAAIAEGRETPKLPDILVNEPINIHQPPAVEKTVSTASGSATDRVIRKYEITNPNLIPDEFWVIDEAKIKRQVNAGVTEILGVRIWTETALTVRGGK